MSGIASFSIGLEIFSRRKKLAGTPLKLRLRYWGAWSRLFLKRLVFLFRKECLARGVDPLCDRTCRGRGHCDSGGSCVCRQGWAGHHCDKAVCSPQCMNGGSCSAPGVCECPAGYQAGYTGRR